LHNFKTNFDRIVGSTQQGDTTSVFWTQIQQVLNDSIAIVDTAARPGKFFFPKGNISTSTSSAVVNGNLVTQFLNDLFPADEMYASTFGNPFFGIVQSISAQNQLTLPGNATTSVTNSIFFHQKLRCLYLIQTIYLIIPNCEGMV